jgi:hypothetical protein
MTTNPDIPIILDAPRTDDLRTILDDELDPLVASIDEIDGCCTLPLRISHNPVCGVVLEIGPYDLNYHDVVQLCEAIRKFNEWRQAPIRKA